MHVRTQKGRGYRPAEADQVGFHGAALPPMEPPANGANGAGAGAAAAATATAAMAATVAAHVDATAMPMPTESMADDAAPPTRVLEAPKKHPNYTAVFAAELIELRPHRPAHRRDHGRHADRDRPLEVPGRVPGPLLRRRASRSSTPSTFATGLALGGLRPVVAIYSTFLQRAFDQTVHDVCQNDQPVLIAVDRAGLVGEDGTSHQGMFTLSAQRQLPNLVVASPRDEQELRSMVRTAFSQDHPFALHYPRDAGFGLPPVEPEILPIGRGEVLREGHDLLFVGLRADRGAGHGGRRRARGRGLVGRACINARFAKPLDGQLILDQARGKRLLVTFEESVATGGFGSGVLEALEEARLTDPALRELAVRVIGIPGDRFVDHGSVADLRRVLRLDAAGLTAQVRDTLALLQATPAPREAPSAGR